MGVSIGLGGELLDAYRVLLKQEQDLLGTVIQQLLSIQ